MRARRRQHWFGLACLLIGLTGLTSLIIVFRKQPWAGRVLWGFLAYQSFWWLVRLYLAVAIWKREPGIPPGLKIWLGITMPLPGLFAVYAGRGKLSAWLTAEEPGEPLTAARADPEPGPADGPAG